MIRHYDGTNAEQITMQSKRGIIWAVEWTLKGHRICATSEHAEKARKNWKRWKERMGYKPFGPAQHRLKSPDGRREICNIVKYDAVTRKVLDVR